MTTQNRNDSGWVVIYALGAIGFALAMVSLLGMAFFALLLGVALTSPSFLALVLVEALGTSLVLLSLLGFWLFERQKEAEGLHKRPTPRHGRHTRSV